MVIVTIVVVIIMVECPKYFINYWELSVAVIHFYLVMFNSLTYMLIFYDESLCLNIQLVISRTI